MELSREDKYWDVCKAAHSPARLLCLHAPCLWLWAQIWLCALNKAFLSRRQRRQGAYRLRSAERRIAGVTTCRAAGMSQMSYQLRACLMRTATICQLCAWD